mmetsp:Transcript_69412/g.115761  ORF Transcript_69412/g.115761 Transcript_69412/m.115761 type:complete len:130 (-) Transcript_69412:11-400(-)
MSAWDTTADERATKDSRTLLLPYSAANKAWPDLKSSSANSIDVQWSACSRVQGQMVKEQDATQRDSEKVNNFARYQLYPVALFLHIRSCVAVVSASHLSRTCFRVVPFLLEMAAQVPDSAAPLGEMGGG